MTLYALDDLLPLTQVKLQGVGVVRARLDEGALLVFDERGRVLVFDASTGALVTNVRV